MTGPRIVVIGAGMAGILRAIKLSEAGYDDFTVYEKAEPARRHVAREHLPGVSCDVPSHLYSYSFAPNPDWSHVFAGRRDPRLSGRRRHRHGVADAIRFGDEVVRLELGPPAAGTSRRRRPPRTVDVVIAATGVLHHPNFPDIEGLDDFAGAASTAPVGTTCRLEAKRASA